MYGMFLLK